MLIRKVLTFVFRALWYLDDYWRIINYGKWYKAGRVHKTAGMWNVHSTEQLLTPELNVHSSPLNNGHIVIFLQASSQTRQPCVPISDPSVRWTLSFVEAWCIMTHAPLCIPGFTIVLFVWSMSMCTLTCWCRMSDGDSLFTLPSSTCQWLQLGLHSQQSCY